MNKDKRITIRFTSEERDNLIKKAKEINVSLSEYIRKKLNEKES